MGFGDSLNLGLDQAVQSIKNAAGIVASTQNNVQSFVPLPWIESNISSKFFQAIDITANNWDQLFPYRLLVIDSTNNKVVFGPNGSILTKDISLQITTGTGSAIVKFLGASSAWLFQLPITPQQLNIQDQYAIQTSATLRGILEEHSGVRFKMITAQGTMGVWPQRSSVTNPPSTPGLIQSLFGGTIQAVGNIVNSVNRVINAATSDHPANKPVSLRPETSTFGQTSTGYYQAMKLQQFLEQYVEAKRNPANASWRLVFDIPKQSQSFVVTPVSYTWQQAANKPMEILYNFQLKAWRRINLDQTIEATQPNNQPLSPGILQRALATIGAAQQVVSTSLSLIGAVTSDIKAPINAFNQTVLYIKGLAGVPPTSADLPAELVTNLQSSIAQYISNNAAALSANVSDVNVRASIASIAATSKQFEGLPIASIKAGQLGNAAVTDLSLSSMNNIFSNPSANFALLDLVPTGSLSLNNAQQAAIQNVINQASQVTISQLKQYRGTILSLVLLLSNNFGTGSAFYNSIFNLPPPTPRIQPITLDEYDILNSLYETLSIFDILTATTSVTDFAIESNMEYVAGLADSVDIEFNIPNSKILAPVPFGLTIEAIAARYLGDPQRWLEIATLNNLREPYIDEVGFQLLLLSNAIGRQITVNTDFDLFVGQTVILKGIGQAPSPRTILDIATLSNSSFLLTLDGLPDLDNFTTAASSFIQAYLPGTVNSQQKIFIPSDLPVPATSSIVPPPSTSSDPLTGLSKVDWLLTDNGDIALNNYGDFLYSSGITNIIQALRIKFGTQAGTLLTHPNFGLNVKVGAISSDLQIQELFNSINNMITQDPRFQGVSNLQISLDGPTLGINLGVQLPNQTGVFPVSFALTAPQS